MEDASCVEPFDEILGLLQALIVTTVLIIQPVDAIELSTTRTICWRECKSVLGLVHALSILVRQMRFNNQINYSDDLVAVEQEAVSHDIANALRAQRRLLATDILRDGIVYLIKLIDLRIQQLI